MAEGEAEVTAVDVLDGDGHLRKKGSVSTAGAVPLQGQRCPRERGGGKPNPRVLSQRQRAASGTGGNTVKGARDSVRALKVLQGSDPTAKILGVKPTFLSLAQPQASGFPGGCRACPRGRVKAFLW